MQALILGSLVSWMMLFIEHVFNNTRTSSIPSNKTFLIWTPPIHYNIVQQVADAKKRMIQRRSMLQCTVPIQQWWHQHQNFRRKKRVQAIFVFCLFVFCFVLEGQDPQKVISFIYFVHENSCYSWFHSNLDGGGKEKIGKENAPPPHNPVVLPLHVSSIPWSTCTLHVTLWPT